MFGDAHSSTGKPVVFCLRPHKCRTNLRRQSLHKPPQGFCDSRCGMSDGQMQSEKALDRHLGWSFPATGCVLISEELFYGYIKIFPKVLIFACKPFLTGRQTRWRLAETKNLKRIITEFHQNSYVGIWESINKKFYYAWNNRCMRSKKFNSWDPVGLLLSNQQFAFVIKT